LKNDVSWKQRNLAAEQRQNPDLGPIIGWKELGEKPKWEESKLSTLN